LQWRGNLMKNIIRKEIEAISEKYYFNFTFSWGYFYFSASYFCFSKKLNPFLMSNIIVDT
jgi:hypothetical protein